MPNNQGNTTSAQRIQVMTLAEAGIEKKIAAASAGMTVSSVYRVMIKAKDREYNKNESSIMKMKYVVDEPRSERPRKANAEKEAEILDAGANLSLHFTFFH
jgi:transposase